MELRTAVLGALLATACGGGIRSSAGGGAGALTPAPPVWSGAEDALSMRLRELAGSLAREGSEPASLSGSGFLVSKQTEAVPILVAPNTCVTIVAVASSGVGDIDAVLFSPEGVVLAEDVQPDTHPALHACAGEQARSLYYALQAYEGSGAYAWGVFTSTEQAWPAIDRVLGGRPGIAADPNAERSASFLEETQSGLGRRGFEPVGEPIEVDVLGGTALRIPLGLEAGYCYSLVVVSDEEAGAVRMRLLAPLGEELTTDTRGLPEATAQVCASEPIDAALELVTERDGAASIRVLRGPQSETGDQNALWLGVRPRGERTSAAPVRPERGRSRQVARGELGPGEARSHTISVRSNRCVRFEAKSERGLLNVEIQLQDALGHRYGKAASSSVVVCVEHHAQLVASIVARVGAGPYTISATGVDRARSLPEGATVLEEGALVDALAARLADGWQGSQPVRRLVLTQGATETAVTVGGGECLRVDVVAKAGAHVAAELRQGMRVLSRASGGELRLETCSAEVGDVTLALGAPLADATVFAVLSTRALAAAAVSPL